MRRYHVIHSLVLLSTFLGLKAIELVQTPETANSKHQNPNLDTTLTTPGSSSDLPYRLNGNRHLPDQEPTAAKCNEQWEPGRNTLNNNRSNDLLDDELWELGDGDDRFCWKDSGEIGDKDADDD